MSIFEEYGAFNKTIKIFFFFFFFFFSMRTTQFQFSLVRIFAILYNSYQSARSEWVSGKYFIFLFSTKTFVGGTL